MLQAAIDNFWCGHGGLLVNVVFSLTGIFHGSAGGMSSGHTWHWGTPEQSYQIPLGKPGLVIPRCETVASRSVTFPLHQRKTEALHPPPPPPPSFSPCAMRICNCGSKGKRSPQHWRGSAQPPHPPTLQQKLCLNQSVILSTSLLELMPKPIRQVQTQLEITGKSSVRWRTLYFACFRFCRTCKTGAFSQFHQRQVFNWRKCRPPGIDFNPFKNSNRMAEDLYLESVISKSSLELKRATQTLKNQKKPFILRASLPPHVKPRVMTSFMLWRPNFINTTGRITILLTQIMEACGDLSTQRSYWKQHSFVSINVHSSTQQEDPNSTRGSSCLLRHTHPDNSDKESIYVQVSDRMDIVRDTQSISADSKLTYSVSTRATYSWRHVSKSFD